jgi:hypothetical protein
VSEARIDVAAASLLAEPPGEGPGYWAGAPGAFVDGETIYVVYRLRWPRPKRGGELRIARFEADRLVPLWRASRDDFASPSIERCAILRVDRVWRLYVSYVDGVDGRWRIDVIEADSPAGFDPSARRPALDADDARAVAVKDPWLRRVGDRWWMFVSYGERPGGARDLHASGDALSTGATKSETGLATSVDGLRWTWEGRVLAAASSGWDKATARLSTAFPTTGGWIGLYDGASHITENYEERCGAARSPDLRQWDRVGSGPAVGSPSGPGAVRYVESVADGDRLRLFFERTRHDGAHELCTVAISRAGEEAIAADRLLRDR